MVNDFFYWKERLNLGCYENFHYGQRATYFLKAFIDIKKKNCLGIFSVGRFFGGNSKPPTNKDLAFVTVPFSLLRWHLLVRHVACAQRRKTNLHGSHDLEIWGKKTNKYRSGGNFSHRKTNSWWPVKFSHISRQGFVHPVKQSQGFRHEAFHVAAKPALNLDRKQRELPLATM